jgi:hypothetical protein
MFVVVLVVIGVFLVLQAFILPKLSDTEQLKYEVVKEYDGFEVRRYEAALFSSVYLNGNTYDETSSQGFRVLAGYIFGGNETGEKIAMTSPVAMEIGDSAKMSFMVPSNYADTSLPKPNNQNIFFEKKSGSVMAAIRFGGWASDERIQEHQEKLIALLKAQKLEHTGKFVYFGYNPPYTVVGRRNEVAVELTNFK